MVSQPLITVRFMISLPGEPLHTDGTLAHNEQHVLEHHILAVAAARNVGRSSQYFLHLLLDKGLN